MYKKTKTKTNEKKVLVHNTLDLCTRAEKRAFPIQICMSGRFEGAPWFIIQPRCAVDVQIYCAGLILKSLFYIIYTRARRQRGSPGKNREKSRAAGVLKDGARECFMRHTFITLPFAVCVCVCPFDKWKVFSVIYVIYILGSGLVLLNYIEIERVRLLSFEMRVRVPDSAEMLFGGGWVLLFVFFCVLDSFGLF